MKMRLIKKILPLAAVAASLFFVVSADASEAFPAFKSRTLRGDAVTNAIFAGKKLTMVNIWATWCPPCVSEMPGLGRLGNSMPEGSQLVGIVCDVSANDRSAKGEADRILSRAKAGFVQIEYSPDMDPYLGKVEAIPTTIFVDSKGNIVGDPMVGSDSEKNYRAAIEKILKGM
jgi:thiol-disulfide isomerase/thioredoxin